MIDNSVSFKNKTDTVYLIGVSAIILVLSFVLEKEKLFHSQNTIYGYTFGSLVCLI